jgi:Carboxypeptidase regulatory-like domain
MIRIFFLANLVVVSLLFATSSNAQTPKKNSTALAGIVLGTDGKPVAHAAVSCQSSGGISPRAVRTDANGKFMITGLKQDSYDLRASANGATSNWEKNISVRRGQTKQVTLRLMSEADSTIVTIPISK